MVCPIFHQAAKDCKSGGDFFLTPPQNRGADWHGDVFYCISANFYPFLTLVPYFCQDFPILFEFAKIEKNNGLECEIQQHFGKRN